MVLNISPKQSPQMTKFLPGACRRRSSRRITAASPGQGARLICVRAKPDGITAEQAIARGILCAGNPDTVYKQIMDIYEKVGGLAISSLSGARLDHQEAEKGIKLLTKEVLPAAGGDIDRRRTTRPCR
jgi:hypothetical protein